MTTVADILRSKSSDAIHSVSPSDTMLTAIQRMAEKGIGALIVLEGGNIAGIVTERDIVAAVARNGAECMDKPISSIMWANVYRCDEAQTVDDLMEMMSKLRARHIPVEKEGRLVGIISIGDVVKSHIRAIKHEADAIKAYIAG